MVEKSAHHALSVEDALTTIGSTRDGLRPEQVTERQEEYGPNELPKEEGRSWFFLLLSQFKSFLIIILLVAALISVLLGHASDSVIILLAVFLNVVVGFVQESKAERALDALRQVVTLEAKVVRDGHTIVIPIEEVVPGDVLLLDAGDKIPADARLISISELQTNEAPLTGESSAIIKQVEPVEASAEVGDRQDMVFFGTTVTEGSGHAVVVATGSDTEIGRIAQLLHSTKREPTPLQLKLDRFARTMGIIVLCISAVIVVIGLVVGLSFVDIFITAVAIAVSAIPEGLVVAVTIILAIGMQRILKRNGLVRNLQAAETLGSTSVICTDKTGTLTEGNMQVVELVTHDYHFRGLNADGEDAEKGLSEMMFAMNIGMLCNDAHVLEGKSELEEKVIIGNLTEQALLRAGISLGLNYEEIREKEPRIDTVPFSSKKKFMATLHDGEEGRRMYVKGAPERILEMSSQIRVGKEAQMFTDAQRDMFEEKFAAHSKKGLRILALAYVDIQPNQAVIKEEDVNGLVFVGFVGIQDPLRPGIADTFAKTAAAGIRTVMITGDHRFTATAIASELGMPVEDHNVMEGDELRKMTQEELNEVVENISVYARVSPEDKLNIIHAWQSKGKVVAMTGDGVNDSPALKAANIGVALGSGTEVAKEVSDIVLLDDNYKTIVAAVEEGRGIFENIRKVTLYLLSDSFSEVIIVVAALMMGLPLPLTAAQILWINLVSDGLPGVALTQDPTPDELMKQGPLPVGESVVNKKVSIIIGAISLVTGLINLFLFWYFWNKTGDVTYARSIVFAALSVDSLLFLFSIRSLRHSVFHKSLFSNMWLWGAVGLGLLAAIAAIYVPFLQKLLGTQAIGTLEWSIVVGSSVVVILLIELLKVVFRWSGLHKTS